jgi:hypothetical protein
MTQTAYKSVALACCLAMTACAGRAPVPVAVIQPVDASMNCAAISAEAQANAYQQQLLAREVSDKTTQNVAMGVVGAVLFWPALFAMDFQGAASTESAALTSRDQYLATLAGERHCVGAPTPLAPNMANR